MQKEKDLENLFKVKRIFKIFLSLGFKDRTEEEKKWNMDLLKVNSIEVVNDLYKDYLNKDYINSEDLKIMKNEARITFVNNDVNYENNRIKNIRIYRKGRALCLLGLCDSLIYFEDDYKKFNGVKQEVKCALYYGLPVYKVVKLKNGYKTKRVIK